MKASDTIEFQQQEFVYSGSKVTHVVKSGDKGRVLGVDDGMATVSLWGTVEWISIPADYNKVKVISE